MDFTLLYVKLTQYKKTIYMNKFKNSKNTILNKGVGNRISYDEIESVGNLPEKKGTELYSQAYRVS